jgi:hypothetical protein
MALHGFCLRHFAIFGVRMNRGNSRGDFVRGTTKVVSFPRISTVTNDS